MLNLVGIVFSGLFVGVLARFFYPGAVELGFWLTVLLGAALMTLVFISSGSGHDEEAHLHRQSIMPKDDE